MPRGRYSHLRFRLVMVGTEMVGQFIWAWVRRRLPLVLLPNYARLTVYSARTVLIRTSCLWGPAFTAFLLKYWERTQDFLEVWVDLCTFGTSPMAFMVLYQLSQGQCLWL